MERDLGDIKGSIGELKGAVVALKEDHLQIRKEGSLDAELMRNELSSMRRAVDSMRETLAEAKGGWRTLVAVGTVSGAVVAVITAIFHWLRLKP